MKHAPVKFVTLIAAAALGAGLAACTMTPAYEQPSLPVNNNWSDIPAYQSPQVREAVQKMSWDSYFSDPALQSVIAAALENNKDLRIATLNIEKARALYRIERSDLLPAINATAAGDLRESTDESSTTGKAVSTEAYSATIGMSSYELDLFGRIRSMTDAALKEYFATQAAQETVRLSLIAETANAYLQLLADEKLLNLSEKTLEAQTKSFDLLKASMDQGIATLQDVSRAETAVETARVNVHQFRRSIEQDKNALFLLMGTAHDERLIPDTSLDYITLPDNLPVGLPSDVLLGRPDVRQAEYELMARNADIGAARAMFFPRISLTGSYGFASDNLSTLFSGDAFGAFGFTPQITLPLFAGGANQAALDAAKIDRDKAVATYEKTIQTAFREVADELAARATLTAQLNAQKRLVDAAGRVYNVSKARHDAGIDNYLSVLDAQRELFNYQQNEIRIQRERLSNLVNLYKVLGGQSGQ